MIFQDALRSVTSAGSGTARSPVDAPVVRTRELRVRLTRNGHEAEVLRGIDLEIKPGEILGLVGESGSGKSVLGNSLLGMLPETARPNLSGSAEVVGTDMVSASAAARRRCRRDHLGAVFQDPMTSLDPTMTIGKQVIEAAGSHDAALQLLLSVQIPDPESRMRRYPHELSGGLRQRVMIAMAVATNPSLVIADEPTTALDVTVQAQVLSLLAGLRDDLGCSILLITHDFGVAAQISNRIAVMYAGLVVEQGATQQVLNSPSHPYTVSLLRSRLSLDTARDRPLPALAGGVPDPRAMPPGCAFEPRCVLSHDACRADVPVLAEIGAEHRVACHADSAVVTAQALTGVSDGTAADASEHPAGPEGPEDTVISARDVEVSFRQRRAKGRRQPAFRALRGIDLDLRRGECLSVVGESGSGKSTLLRVMAGLTPYKGTLVRDITAPTQMVFQDSGSSLTPWLTVGSMLCERLHNQRVSARDRKALAYRALERTGLPDSVFDARPHELSGGQRQRVALARATVVPPSVLLCDEPTSALDVSLAATVLNLIAELREEFAITVVFVTHDLAVARVVADRIAVMYLGRIVELGGAEALIANPQHPYTSALIESVPGLGRAAPPVSGEPASPTSPPAGCEYHPRCTVAQDACADPQLVVRLGLPPDWGALPEGDSRRVACIRPGGK
ncbi:ABC transporter ATP-binding protein [Mycolicibacterium austroafricanum]|nr:ABC transporter ATP-binding protein [Mycolicibacterium austroafricanum]